MRTGIRMVAVCSYGPCSEIFTKRPSEIIRWARPFCDRRCFHLSRTTGRTKVEGVCAGCGATFLRSKHDLERADPDHRYCGQPCYRKHVDRRAMGVAGGSAPHVFPPGVTVERARKAGAGKARKMSKEDWVAFSRLGYEARRRKLGDIGMAAASRKGQLLGRIGSNVALGVRLGKRSDE